LTLPFDWSPDATLIDSQGNRHHNRLGDALSAAVSLDDVVAAWHQFFALIRDRRCEPVIGTAQITATAAGHNAGFQCQTGGTTQTPKQLRRSCASWTASFVHNANRFGPDQTYATLGHLSHSLTLYAGAEALVTGADYVPVRVKHPAQQRRVLTDQRVTVLYATPTQIRMLCMGAVARALAGLRYVMIGGGILDQVTQDLISLAAPDAQILQFYGAAETSFVTLSGSDTPKGSVGRAFADVHIDIRNAAPDDPSGDVWVTSPYLFDGYTRGASATTSRENGWICVGERGYLDEQGYLFLTGRASRMFLARDKNIHPEEIETCIMGCSGVVACAVLGRPDVLRGNRICAMVCAQDRDIASKILGHVQKHLPPFMIPSDITILDPDEWPMLASGKPDLAKLKDRL